MKKHVISSVAVLMVLFVVLAAVGQQQRSRQGRGGRMSRETRLEAIKVIEAQLAKLKEEPQIQRPEGGYQNLSEEERAKFREQMMKVFQERQKVTDTIVAQVARLQGQRPPEAENAKFVIVNIADLKPIQDAAANEKATETSKLLGQLIARASGQRGFGRRPGPGGGPPRQRQQ